MENAGASIENGAILKGKGIGTAATRAGIIKKLFDTGMVQTEPTSKKAQYIVPTGKGISVIQVLPKELYSPKITADWETRIEKIVEGKLSEEEFLSEFETFIREKVSEVKNSESKVLFKKERQSYGKCPWCSVDKILSTEAKDSADIYCYEKKDERGKLSSKWFYCANKCGYGIDTADKAVVMRTGRKLTDTEVKKMIAKGRIGLECKRKEGNGTYQGVFSTVKKEINSKVYCNIVFDFANKKVTHRE